MSRKEERRAETISISRCHAPVTALGPGRRIGIWMQGCSIGCAGCIARDTWVREARHTVRIGEVLAWCSAQAGIDGVTVSGGEPFEQPEALDTLIDGLRAWELERAAALDIMVYSGLTQRRLVREHTQILQRIDVLVPEPYAYTAGPGGRWRGSANQPLVALTALGRARLAGAGNTTAPRFQVAGEPGGAWIVGIPEAGDLERIEAEMAHRGVKLREVSWRA